MASKKRLTFQVIKKAPELIPPAKPTPHEFKPLSDIDHQDYLRLYVSIIQFYQSNPNMEGKDPSKVMRDAIAKALVFCYPFAGRLREFAGRKLVVECTGEGVVFVEADANVTLQEFGDIIYPPIPCVEELIHDVPGTAEIINCPLMIFQVTRLKCGGFTFGLRFNHTMSDGIGIAQFMSIVNEFACGAEAPSVPPVWERHLLSSRQLPCVADTNNESQVAFLPKRPLFPPHDLVHRSFHFWASDISALRNSLPPHFQSCSKFELVAACVWRCRTIAVFPDPNEEVTFCYMINFRNRLNPPLPEGYYGNAIVFPAATTTAGQLSNNPLHYALELVKKIKHGVTKEYVESVVDSIRMKGRPTFKFAGTYMVSDLTNMGGFEMDYGWGKARYGGPVTSGFDPIPGLLSFFSPLKNDKGERGIVASICLPRKTMEIFVKELDAMKLTNRKEKL